MNTFLCNKRTRDCPENCVHSTPHKEIEKWNKVILDSGEEKIEKSKCSEVARKCVHWHPPKKVECVLYDSGTGNLFDSQDIQ